MEQRSAVSLANPRVIVDLATAKAANTEMRRKFALERAKDPEKKETHGLGFSVLGIGAATPTPHTREEAAAPGAANPTAEFL